MASNSLINPGIPSTLELCWTPCPTLLLVLNHWNQQGLLDSLIIPGAQTLSSLGAFRASSSSSFASLCSFSQRRLLLLCFHLPLILCFFPCSDTEEASSFFHFNRLLRCLNPIEFVDIKIVVLVIVVPFLLGSFSVAIGRSICCFLMTLYFRGFRISWIAISCPTPG